MLYFKTSQPVPGKGDAWMYYECHDDQSVRRYLTYIPATRETDRVPRPFIKKLQRPDLLMPATREEFEQYWPAGEDDFSPAPEESQAVVKEKLAASGKYFDPDMPISEAMMVHPQVAEVFAAFHLGGCSSCGVADFESIAQVCMGYGVDVDLLLEVLEGLLEKKSEADESTARVEEAIESDGR